MNKKLAYISSWFGTDGGSLRFLRETETSFVMREYRMDRISDSSMDRIKEIVYGGLCVQLNSNVSLDNANTGWKIVGRPQEFGEGVCQGIDGDLTITATPRERVEIRRACRRADDKTEYDYPSMDDYLFERLYALGLDFEGDAGNAGIAMFSGPVIVQRAYKEVDTGDALDDTDWDKSNVWAYDEYVYRHPVEDLINYGKVSFYHVDKD